MMKLFTGKNHLSEKMPGDEWQKFANLRVLFAYMYGHPGKKLLFMGDEIGQWKEWNHDESLEWHILEYPSHKGLQHWVRDLNHLYKNEPALYDNDFSNECFEWINFSDSEKSVISFIRKSKDNENILIFILNFTPVPRYDYRVAMQNGGYYEEILNSDAERYWGSNIGNYGKVLAEPVPWEGKEYSLNLSIPPLGAVILRPVIKKTVKKKTVKKPVPKKMSKTKKTVLAWDLLGKS